MGGMDGKTKKVLNHLKKSGGGLEVLDLAFALNMDEKYIQNTLDTLSQQGLAASLRNEQGKTLWSAASEKPAAKTSGADMMVPGDRTDEFSLEDFTAATAAGTETIAATFEPAETKTPPATQEFIVEPPKREQPYMQQTVTIPAVTDEIAPAKEETPVADDDFEPKPKKEKKVKEPKPAAATIESADEFEPAAAPKKSSGKDPGMITAMVSAVLTGIIVAIIVTAMASGGSKIGEAVEAAKAEFAKELQDVKSAADAKIEKLESDNKALTEKAEALEGRVKKLEEASQKAPAKRQARRR